MRTRWWLIPVVAMTFTHAAAQLQVSVKLPSDTFLLYEAVPVTVQLRNTTGRTLELIEDPAAPWLDFLILDARGRLVPSTAHARTWGDVLIPPGDTVQRTFNITPWYELRQRGQYRIQAEVRTEALYAISAPARFVLLTGHEIWRRSFGVTSLGDQPVVYQTYRLLLKRSGSGSVLYAQIEDEARQVIRSMLPLGPYIPFGEPQANVDSRGALHVLHRNGPETFAYHEIAPTGEIIAQQFYSELTGPPRLETQPGGLVTVLGDRLQPAMERVLTQEELSPPPPPTQEPPARNRDAPKKKITR